MTLLQLIGPFLLAQAVLLNHLARRAKDAVLRPRRSDYAVFGTALGWLSIPLCGLTLLTALRAGDLPVAGVGLASLAIAGWWTSGRRERRPEPHAQDLEFQDHVQQEMRGGLMVSARLLNPGDVGGVDWPAGTELRFDAEGWLIEAVLGGSRVLAGFAVKADEPVKFDEVGRIRELVAEDSVSVGRLPRGGTEARGAEVVVQAGTRFDPRQLRGIVLAKDTVIRGVRVPAGSTVSASHGVRVELAAETEVFGECIEKGARLQFPPAGGMMALVRKQPEVRVSLTPKDSYRTGGERRTIALFEDGRIE